MKKCKNCGTSVDDGVMYCPHCGNSNFDYIPENNQYSGGNSNGGYNSGNQNTGGSGQNGNSKSLAIIAYLTWIGFIVAIATGDKDDPFLKFHLNQALVLNLFSLVNLIPIPIIHWLLSLCVAIFWLISFIGACRGEMKETPLLGKIHILT